MINCDFWQRMLRLTKETCTLNVNNGGNARCDNFKISQKVFSQINVRMVEEVEACEAGR